MTVRNSTNIELIETGIIYRNPEPALRAIHAMHPSLTWLGPNELLAAFDLGQGAASFDYATNFAHSNDSGRTWTTPKPILQEIDPPLTTHILRIRRMSDGLITAFGNRNIRDDPHQLLINPETFGHVPTELILVQSHDGGHNWIRPQTLKLPVEGSDYEICHPLVELKDGRWLAPVSIWRNWDGSMPNPEKTLAFVSRDRGKTWPESIDIMADEAGNFMYLENSLIELQDGRLLAVAWEFDPDTGHTGPTPYAISEDAQTFGPTMETGLKGQTAKVIQLADGRIFCLYRRVDKPGLWANVSRLDGDKWVNLAEAPIWQGAPSGMAGKEAAGKELDALKFGCPNLTLMHDGSVYAAFWCWEDCISNIRWFQINVN